MDSEKQEGSENGGILDRVAFARHKKVKQKFGRVKVDVAALAKAVGDDEARRIITEVNKVEGLKQAIGMRMRKSNEEDLRLFSKHLTFAGNMADLAKDEGIDVTLLTYKIRKVAYYEYVIERKQLPLMPKQ